MAKKRKSLVRIKKESKKAIEKYLKKKPAEKPVKTTRQLARLDAEKVRELGESLYRGELFTSDQVPGNLLHMVFMPLAFGALSGWSREDVEKIGVIYAKFGEDHQFSHGVNGMPVFSACRFMHVDDWKLVRERATKIYEAVKSV
jgi:hypothetical protein